MRIYLTSLVIAMLLALGLASAAGASTPGQLYGAGYAEYGQLGNSEGSDYYFLFQPIEGLSNVVQASPGYYASVALLSNGTVDASGYGYYGELGNGETKERNAFSPVPGISNATAVAAGAYTEYALLSNGTVEAWGYNDVGQLGDNEHLSSGCDCSDTASLVEGVGGHGVLSNVVAISAGYEYALALLSNGTVVAWGYGVYDELGNGQGKESDVPVEVEGVGGSGTLSNVVAISAGGYYSLALLSSGEVVAWGYGAEGELGNGKYSSSPYPVQVEGGGGSGTLTNVSAISAGGYFGLALLSDGHVDSWGYNDYGELGNGETTPSSTPVAVSGLTDASAVGAGYYYALAVQSGTLYGWGYDGDGELGNGFDGVFKTPKTDSAEPTGIFALEHGGYDDTSLVLQGATAGLSGTSLAFGDQTVGATSSAQTVTLKNDGPLASMVVSGDVLSGSSAFAKSSDTCAGATLAPGASCAVSVTFKPAAAGGASASLSFSTTAANSLPTVGLGGTGVAASAAVAKAPELGALSLSPTMFRAASSGPTVLAATATGTLVSYTDSAAATTTFEVEQATSGAIGGHGKAKSCGKPPKHPKGKLKHCVFYVAVGGFSHSDAAGANSLRFTGRLHGKKLAPGSYRLLASAKSSAGKSNTATASFKIEK